MVLRSTIGSMQRQLRRGPALSVGELVLTPVVLEERGAGMVGGGCWVVAATRPVGVIVKGPDGCRLLRITDASDA